MNAPTLEFIDLSAGYNGRNVLRNISGEIPSAGRVALIGPNGCGKSTLLRVLMGVHPASGEILLGDSKISNRDAMERNRIGIGCVRQGVNSFPSLTGRENLEMAFIGHYKKFSVRVEEITALLPIVRECLNRRAGLLSGGMRQSLALGMVLMNRPRILLLDEPLAGLSPKAAGEMIDSLGKIHEVTGTSWLIVEHRLPLIRRAVDAVWIMRDGEFIHKTDDVAVLEDPDELAEHYQLT